MANDSMSLDEIYKSINQIETIKGKVSSYILYEYYYYFPLILSIVFFMLYLYLKSVKGVVK